MRRDVVIVGGGMAGAACAFALRGSGRSVTVLEGRDRFGGRAFARAFPGEGTTLDLGGGWITPWQDRVRALLAATGIATRPRHPVTGRIWRRDGAAHGDHPASSADRASHERLMARVAIDTMLVKLGHIADEHGRPLHDVSFTAYLERNPAPSASHDLLRAWWTVSGNGDPRKIPVGELLASIGYGDGTPDAIIECWTDGIDGGVQAVVDAVLRASGAELRLGAPVRRIQEQRTAVRVHLDGEAIEADAVVLATGLNPLRAIEFDPPLEPPAARAAARGHEGRSFKLWALCDGVPVGTLATGGGEGIEFAFAERGTSDGRSFVVAFGLAGRDLDPTDRVAVEEGLLRFFPSVRVAAVDAHDWVADPFSLGTWVATPLDAPDTVDPATWRPQGRLLFAGSDIAAEQAGWFEGAVRSGEAAAAVILRRPHGAAA